MVAYLWFRSVLILTLLNKLRKKPLLEFLAIILLCGCIEYYISWFLEQLYDGMRWWDYSDYFLNLNGRICVEGLLAFGVGGMVIVYVYAPFLDCLFRRIPKKILVPVYLVLILIFCADLIYSGKNPKNLIIALMWENSYGYLKKDHMRTIVTSGVGLFGPNMRVGTIAEICSIKVHFQ